MSKVMTSTSRKMTSLLVERTVLVEDAEEMDHVTLLASVASSIVIYVLIRNVQRAVTTRIVVRVIKVDFLLERLLVLVTIHMIEITLMNYACQHVILIAQLVQWEPPETIQIVPYVITVLLVFRSLALMYSVRCAF